MAGLTFIFSILIKNEGFLKILKKRKEGGGEAYRMYRVTESAQNRIMIPSSTDIVETFSIDVLGTFSVDEISKSTIFETHLIL